MHVEGSGKTSWVVLARSLSNLTSTPLMRALAAYRRLNLMPGVTPDRSRPAHPKRAKQLNASDLPRLVERYEAGATVYELADEFKIDRRTVSIRLKQQGVSLRFQSPTPDVVDEMVRLYESGLSLAKVADRTGFVAHTVQRHLRDRGVQMRDLHGATDPDCLVFAFLASKGPSDRHRRATRLRV